VIRRIDIDERGDESGLPASPGAHKGVHGRGAAHNAEDEDRFNSGGVAEAEKVEQQLGEEMAERPVDVEERIAVAKGEVRATARPPYAVLHQPVILKEKVDMVARVVGAPEVAGQQEGCYGEYGEGDRQPEQRVAPQLGGCVGCHALRITSHPSGVPEGESPAIEDQLVVNAAV